MKSYAFRIIRALTAGAAWLLLAGAIFSPGRGLCAMNSVGKGFPQSQAYGETLNNNVKSALCVDCHTRTPASLNGGADNTARGSHFVYLSSASPTQRTVWEKLTPWSGTTYSKYGAVTAANQPPGVAGEMICESCHNMKSNVGKYKLLALDNEAADPNVFCEGCHTEGSMPAHTRHPMTLDPVYTRGGLALSKTEGILAGTLLQNPLDNATYVGDGMNCRSCHGVHGSPTVTGARILKKGTGGGVLGMGSLGAERQYDIDASGVNRLVTDYTPLCISCHTQ